MRQLNQASSSRIWTKYEAALLADPHHRDAFPVQTVLAMLAEEDCSQSWDNVRHLVRWALEKLAGKPEQWAYSVYRLIDSLVYELEEATDVGLAARHAFSRLARWNPPQRERDFIPVEAIEKAEG